MNQEPKKQPALMVLSVIALLLLAGSAYCWSRARERTTQAPVNVEAPIHLTDGSVLNIPLTIPPGRACEAEIQYPKSASADVWKDLRELKGTAILTNNGKVVAEAAMPTNGGSGYPLSAGTTLFRFKSVEEGQYSLSLKVDHIPIGLANVEGKVKIQSDPHRNKDLLGFTILSETLGVVAILIIIPVTYSWLRNRRRSS